MNTSYFAAIGISAVLLFGCGGEPAKQNTAASSGGTSASVAAPTDNAGTYPAQFKDVFYQSCLSGMAESGNKIPEETQKKYCECATAYVQQNYPFDEYMQHEQGLAAGKKADQDWFTELAAKTVSACNLK